MGTTLSLISISVVAFAPVAIDVSGRCEPLAKARRSLM
jgi:hypothetical protein